MFIRRTQTRNRSSGDHYYTFRLVRSKRVGDKVKQLTLLNLGRHFDVDPIHWPELCSRIEELLSGQATLMPVVLPKAVERHAQRITAQIVARQAAPPVVNRDAVPVSDVQSVDVDSMTLVRPRSVGVEQAALWAMNEVKFHELLKNLGFTTPQRAAALGSIIGRMAIPGSERATWGWLTERSGLGERLDIDYEAMSMAQLYRVSDRLYAARETIERSLFNRVSDLFGLSTTVTLYDLTRRRPPRSLSENRLAYCGRA